MPKTKREFDVQAANEWPVANTPNLSALEARFAAIEFHPQRHPGLSTPGSLSDITERLANVWIRPTDRLHHSPLGLPPMHIPHMKSIRIIAFSGHLRGIEAHVNSGKSSGSTP